MMKKIWVRKIEIPGCPNLFEIIHRNRNTGNRIFRGGQPTREGFGNLYNLLESRRSPGTIINLRSGHDDKPLFTFPNRNLERGNRFFYHEIHTHEWDVDQDEVEEFLDIMQTPYNWNFFFHCRAGKHRTGIMAAMYRIKLDGWSVDEAVEEMVNGPFGYNRMWFNLPCLIKWWDVKKRIMEIHRNVNE